MKNCNKCNKVKPFSEFHKKKDSPDNLRASCKVCRNLESKEWYENNKERRLKLSKEWNKENKEQKRKNDNNWWRKNPDKRYSKFKRFHENNPHKNAEYIAKRRAAKLQRTPEWLTDDHLWMIKEVYELAQLRSEATKVDHHVDHIVPLQGKDVSGLHVPWNLQVIPWYDNLSKSNKTVSLT